MEVTPWTIHGHPIPVTAQQRLQRNIRYGRDGAEIRKGCDVQHKPGSLTLCPVLFWAPQLRKEIIPLGRVQRRSLSAVSCWVCVRT